MAAKDRCRAFLPISCPAMTRTYLAMSCSSHSRVSASTGVAETTDPARTLNLALKLNPEVREVLILHDYTVSGLADRREVENAISQLSRPVSVRFIEDKGLAEILNELEQLPPTTLVLLAVFNKAHDGQVLDGAAAGKVFSTHSSVPVYNFDKTRS